MFKTLKEMNRALALCNRCPLRQTATQPVPGSGDVGVKLMLIGEAPGREEDRLGIPFVGRSGKKLNELMALGGIGQNDIYLTNTCKCRPPDNRKPRKKEIKTCLTWLNNEIYLIQPTRIITLGSVPLSLFTNQGVAKLHGTLLDVELPDFTEETHES